LKNCPISIAAFSALSEPCTEFSPTDRANSLRMVPSAASAIFGDGALAFQHLDHHRGRDHEIHQFAEERPLLVDGVEGFSLVAAHADAALGDDAQAGVLDHRIDLAGEIASRGVRLDDRKGAFGHGS